jgi:hypothetical protein
VVQCQGISRARRHERERSPVFRGGHLGLALGALTSNRSTTGELDCTTTSSAVTRHHTPGHAPGRICTGSRTRRLVNSDAGNVTGWPASSAASSRVNHARQTRLLATPRPPSHAYSAHVNTASGACVCWIPRVVGSPRHSAFRCPARRPGRGGPHPPRAMVGW